MKIDPNIWIEGAMSFVDLKTMLAGLLVLVALATASCNDPGSQVEGSAVTAVPSGTADQMSPLVSSTSSAGSVKRVRLSEKGYRPTGLSGSLLVGIGLDWQVHLIDVITGERRRLTSGLDRKREAVISDSHVAWTSQNRIREILSNAPLVRRSYHIFVMDIETRVTRRITSGTAMRRNLQIDGSRLVWEESRHMVGDRYTEHDIYAYDMTLDERIPVAVAPGSQRSPAIQGDRIVWTDDRNCPETQEAGVSARSCPGGLLDIYLYDIATEEEMLVANSAASGYHAPDIYGDNIVWRGHSGRYNENTALHFQSLANRRTRTIVSLDHGNIGRPIVSDEYVVWTVSEPLRCRLDSSKGCGHWGVRIQHREWDDSTAV